MLRTIYNNGNYYHIGVGAVGLLIYPVLLAAVRTSNPKLLLPCFVIFPLMLFKDYSCQWDFHSSLRRAFSLLNRLAV